MKVKFQSDQIVLKPDTEWEADFLHSLRGQGTTFHWYDERDGMDETLDACGTYLTLKLNEED